MVVTWTTFNETKSEVEYGLLGGRLFEMSARGDAALFVDSGEEERKMYIHRVTLTDLKPAATYGGCRLNTTRFLSQHHATMSERLLFFSHSRVISVYHCGSDDGWSDVFSFAALNDSASFSPRFALYGDLGNENPQSLARLQKETQLGMYDAILHIGELSADKEDRQRSKQSGRRRFNSCFLRRL